MLKRWQLFGQTQLFTKENRSSKENLYERVNEWEKITLWPKNKNFFIMSNKLFCASFTYDYQWILASGVIKNTVFIKDVSLDNLLIFVNLPMTTLTNFAPSKFTPAFNNYSSVSHWQTLDNVVVWWGERRGSCSCSYYYFCFCSCSCSWFFTGYRGSRTWLYWTYGQVSSGVTMKHTIPVIWPK